MHCIQIQQRKQLITLTNSSPLKIAKPFSYQNNENRPMGSANLNCFHLMLCSRIIVALFDKTKKQSPFCIRIACARMQNNGNICLHLNLSLILDRKPIIACQKAYAFNVYLIYNICYGDRAKRSMDPKVMHTVHCTDALPTLLSIQWQTLAFGLMFLVMECIHRIIPVYHFSIIALSEY